MVVLTQETQLLRLSQVSGSAVGVSVVGTGLLVTISVTLGATLLLGGCAAATQSAARQVACACCLPWMW